MNPHYSFLSTRIGFRRLRQALLFSAALATAATAGAASIGIDFMTGGNVGNTNGSLLLPTDVAGAAAYAQANWNCMAGALGTNVALLDGAGAATTVAVSWSAPNTWSQSGNTVSQGAPDPNLINGYLDNNGNANVAISNPFNMFSTTTPANANRNWPLVYLTGLGAWMAAQGAAAYDVVIYADGDASSGRTGEYWPVAASGEPSALTVGADAATHVFMCDLTNFISNLTYYEVSPFIQNGAIPGGLLAEFGNFPGNYTVVRSLTNDTILLRTQRYNSRAPINAVQIVPRATPLPTEFASLYDAPVYAGGRARFAPRVAGLTPMTFQWQKNGLNLADGGNLSGATSQTLTVSSVTAADVASYALVVSNALGVVTSTPAALTLVTPAPNSYPEKIATNGPTAYWRFNETADLSGGFAPAYDAAGGCTAIYGLLAANGYNGITGPQPSDWPGFESGNLAYQSSRSGRLTYLMAPPLNLMTNAATFCAWIFPTAAQGGFTGLLSTRNGNDVACLGYGNNNNLGYTWNSNNAATYNFISGLVPLTNAWSFVALAVSPSNAILYCYNTSGQLSATNAIAHTIQGFSGPTYLGGDPASSIAAPQGRSFVGTIDEVAVFNRTLPPSEIYNLYKKGLGLNAIGPSIPQQPQSLALFEGRTARFAIVASGDTPLTYRWRKNGQPLTDGGNISGALTPALTISSVTIANDAATYDVVVGNVVGSLPSDPVTLQVVASNSVPIAYEAKLRAANPVAYWRFNEAAGSVSVYDYWGGHIATNDNATLEVGGPTPPDFSGMETTNLAASFDGISSYVASTASLLNNRSQFSVVGWFNTPGSIGNRIGLFGQNDVAEFGFHGNGSDGQAQLGVWTPYGSAYLNQSNIVAGAWYLVAAVASGTNVSLTLVSTNGAGGFQVLQASGTGSTTNYGQSPFPFRIGGGGVLDVAGNYFPGLIDEVAVFDRALSVGELSDLFGAALLGGDLPPGIAKEPSSLVLYAGRPATFSVSAVGTSPSFQWRKGGVPLAEGGTLSGTTTPTLTISGVGGADTGDYDVVITNRVGSVTSTVATLTVIVPSTGSFEAAVIAANPLAYYRLNETNDPAGAPAANEYWGGYSGVYGVGASNGFNGVLGPQLPGYTFPVGNYALQVAQSNASSYATAPFGSLSTNTVTMCMWIQPTGTFDGYAGLLVNRNSGVAGGFGYAGGQIGYTWNNNNANTYNFRSGLVPPLNEWSFVALVVSPTEAIVYQFNTHGELSATNVVAHTSDVFGNNWQIGNDNNDNANTGARTFTGLIDEVAVFTRCLTATELRQLYVAGKVGVANSLTYEWSAGNLILSWPYGMLLQAEAPTGPWLPVPGNPASPYSVAATNGMQFFRVLVQ